jgi:hypothetical protein
MKIGIKRASAYQCEYTVTRDDGSVEVISLDTKTYLIHDVCHFAVEKHLAYANGFWGMLSQGFSFGELFGKDNMQAKELRLIEEVVGPVQSVYWGHIRKEDFQQFIEHTGFDVPEGVLDACLGEIEGILRMWEPLSVGESLALEWVPVPGADRAGA